MILGQILFYIGLGLFLCGFIWWITEIIRMKVKKYYSNHFIIAILFFVLEH